MNYGEAALPVMLAELGVKESPPDSNDGPRVRVYRMGHGPEPWCADFGTWGLVQVGFPLPKWNWSFCPAWEAAARDPRVRPEGMEVIRSPEVGAIVLYDWDGGEADHYGTVVRLTPGDPAGDFVAIEGNTAVGNDSNGGEVMLRARRLAQVQCFIRTPEMPKPTLAQRLGKRYGPGTVRTILRNLRNGIAGTIPNPRDRQMVANLVADGMGVASARAVVKSIRKGKP